MQYWHWLWGVLHLNFGRSLITGVPVSTELAARFPVTLSLVAAASLAALVIGVPLGVASGLRPNSVVDSGARVASSVGVAVPNFWLALILVSAFAVQVKIFPPSGFTKPSVSFAEWACEITLPALALGVAVAAALARQLRGSIVEVMDAAYVRTAWAKGLTLPRVMSRHVVKNAAMPAITILGLQIGYLLGGAVIIEQIFSIPGLGTYMLQGITDHDLPVVQGVAPPVRALPDGHEPDCRHQLWLPKPESSRGMTVDSEGPVLPSELADGPLDLRDDSTIAWSDPGWTIESTSGKQQRVRTFLSQTGAVVALGWIVFLVLVALLAPVLVWHSPTNQDLLHTFARASWTHPLGTDDLGRDVLSRLAYGARISLRVSFEVVGIALVFAIPIGIYSGYRGGQVDNVLMRFMDAGLSFPPLVLALAIAGVLGPGVNNTVLAISVVFVPSFVRLIRGQTLAIREEPFIEASRPLGTPTPTIALRRVLPKSCRH